MTILRSDQRLVIAYNPHSSRAAMVQAQVFDRLKKAGFQYETLEVQQASLADNVALLAPQIRDGDVVLSAAGDGSAHAVAHAVIAANKPDVCIGFLAYGNFNDIPHSFNTTQSLRDPVVFLQQARSETLYPLSIQVDGKHFRHALLYATFGWTALAAARFDIPATRQRVQSGKVSTVRNVWHLGLYYLSSRRRSYLPSFVQDQHTHTNVTDILCVNGPVVAGLFKTGTKYYAGHTFLYKKLNVAWLLINVPFLVKGLFGHMPGEERVNVAMEFTKPSIVPIQCDGEVTELHDVSHIHVEKSVTPLHVLLSKQ